ncbi:SRPBCC family protein [Nocardia sp. NPDC059180]|uniref:SRPBCC family protein n=1 Tax=Nocardia sp. NPDC059180 TaxID=3346761 RepID=UPI0036B93DBF
MIEVSDSIQIDRPVDVVFDYVADQTNAPHWQDGLTEVRRTTDGPVGVGTAHSVVRTFLGRRLELTNEYVRFEPGREIAFTVATGPSRMEVTYRTEPEAGGTRLSCEMRMEQKGLFNSRTRWWRGACAATSPRTSPL